MKRVNRASLIAAATALFCCSLAAEAAAADQWTWLPITGHAAVSVNTKVYVLGNTWGTQGWRVQYYDIATNGGTPFVGNAAGTSIAVDNDGGVWVAQANGAIQNVLNTDNFSGNLGCDGQTWVLVRQELGHNSLAIGDPTQPYIIDLNGNVYAWTASNNCWTSLPPLPSGVAANDIAVWGGSAILGGQRIRAIDANGTIYALDGTAWSEVFGTGRAKASGTNGPGWQVDAPKVVGWDNMSIWEWQANTGSNPGWHQPAGTVCDWAHWQIYQLGSSRYPGSSSFNAKGVLTGIDGRIWAYGYFPFLW